MPGSYFWDSYLIHTASAAQTELRLVADRNKFHQQRAFIDSIARARHPESVAILGAGYLSDIPLGTLIRESRKLYLLDWVSEPVKIGLSRSIIARTNNNYTCLMCRKKSDGEYCKNFTGKVVNEGVCTGFEVTEKPHLSCRNYLAGEEPTIIRADLSNGFARGFAEKIERNIGSFKTPKDAFVKALQVADSITPNNIPVAEGTIDLVTSSMLISQFEFEPYGYFSSLLEERFGRKEILRHEERLIPFMERLRSKLFIMQTNAHLKEMSRIAKKDGHARLYLCAELFHSDRDMVRHVLVQDMSRVFELVGNYFDFCFEHGAEKSVLSESRVSEGRVFNLNLLLIPKAA